MTSEKMTVHKALSELKIIDNRIERAINEGTYCVANKVSNKMIHGISIQDYRNSIQGDFDKPVDLIKRRNAIKRAVVLSNAQTKVKVGEVEYTVAEAIEMNNSGLVLKETLHIELKRQLGYAKGLIANENGKSLEERAEKYVQGIYTDTDKKSSEIEKLRKDFIESNTYELVDPIGIVGEIEKLEKEISDFKVEVDAALSVSNAITEIEISY